MRTATAERRRQTRPAAQPIPVKIVCPLKPAESQANAVLVDLHEEGCGLQLAAELTAGQPVTLTADFRRTGGELSVRGRVAWSRANGRQWRAGVQFTQRIGAASSKTSTNAGPSSGAEQEQRVDPDQEDLYEILQISPNADPDTVHRIYRFLAQRFHPDNQETGNSGQFRRIHDAYQTLSDAEKRSAYDATYRRVRSRRWKIFDQASAVPSVESEKATRQGILGLLYTKRRTTPEAPGMNAIELEELLGVAREHLEFPLWYLKENGLVVRTDNGRYSITVLGVNQAEQTGASWLRKDRLLE